MKARRRDTDGQWKEIKLEDYEPLIQHLPSGRTREHAEFEVALYNALKKDIEEGMFRGVALLCRNKDFVNRAIPLSISRCRIEHLQGATVIYIPKRRKNLTEETIETSDFDDMINNLSHLQLRHLYVAIVDKLFNAEVTKCPDFWRELMKDLGYLGGEIFNVQHALIEVFGKTDITDKLEKARERIQGMINKYCSKIPEDIKQ